MAVNVNVRSTRSANGHIDIAIVDMKSDLNVYVDMAKKDTKAKNEDAVGCCGKSYSAGRSSTEKKTATCCSKASNNTVSVSNEQAHLIRKQVARFCY